MKNLFVLIIVLLLTFESKGQITLDHKFDSTTGQWFQYSFPNGNVTVVDLLLHGKKWAVNDSDKLLLYNSDYSLWKTIIFPEISGYKSYGWIYYVAENLFKIDGKVDVALGYASGSSTSGTDGKFVIIDEDGAIINEIDSIYQNGYGTPQEYVQIFSLAQDTFKLLLPTTNWAVTYQGFNIYSLPGTLPCESCNYTLGVANTVKPYPSGSISDPIPNPTSGSTLIKYALPISVENGEIDLFNTSGERVKEFPVSANNNSISIDVSNLPSGMYYYDLKAGSTFTSSRKMLVLK